MSIKILTKNSIDNTNIDGARGYHFSIGMKSGIIKGAFNEGRFFASSSTIIALDTCELIISGHRIVIDSVQYLALSNKPATPTKYSMIAEISVNDNSEPTFRLFIQPTETELIQQNLFNTINGIGTYQINIGNFTLNTNGEIQDVNKVAELISGSVDITNKANKDLSNVTYPQVTANGIAQTGAGDRVVESYISSDGNTWYRKWASGWKECGGYYLNVNSWNMVWIQFPVEINNVLSALVTPQYNINEQTHYMPHIQLNVTNNNNGITYDMCIRADGSWGPNTNNSGVNYYWEVKGY